MKGYGVAGGFLRETPVSVFGWQGNHKAWSVLSGEFAGTPAVLVTLWHLYRSSRDSVGNASTLTL